MDSLRNDHKSALLDLLSRLLKLDKYSLYERAPEIFEIRFGKDPEIHIETYTTEKNRLFRVECGWKYGVHYNGLKNHMKIHEAVLCAFDKHLQYIREEGFPKIKYIREEVGAGIFFAKLIRHSGMNEQEKVFIRNYFNHSKSPDNLYVKQYPAPVKRRFRLEDIDRNEDSLSTAHKTNFTWETDRWIEHLIKTVGPLGASFGINVIEQTHEWANWAYYTNHETSLFGNTFPNLSFAHFNSEFKKEFTQSHIGGYWVVFEIPKEGLYDSRTESYYPFPWAIGKIQRCHLSENIYSYSNWEAKLPEKYYADEFFSPRNFMFEIEFYKPSLKEGKYIFERETASIPAKWIKYELRHKENTENFWDRRRTELEWRKAEWTKEDLGGTGANHWTSISHFSAWIICHIIMNHDFPSCDRMSLNEKHLSIPLYKEAYEKDLAYLKSWFELWKASDKQMIDEMEIEKKFNERWNQNLPENPNGLPPIFEVRSRIDQIGYVEAAKFYGVNLPTLRFWSKNYVSTFATRKREKLKRSTIV